jgi:catechol 2,3-dioxygenase
MESKDQHPQLSHLGIFTDQQNKMQEFYERVLGLLVTDAGVAHKFKRRIVFMSSATNQHHQFVLVQREPGDPPLGPLFQLSFKVDSLDGIRLVRARAAENGATNFRLMNHGNSWSLYFKDPECNTVEIYLDTPWYVSQPFADELDLDQPDDEIYRHTEERVLAIEGTCSASDWSVAMAARLEKESHIR